MIELPKVKRWTGDGYGDAAARVLTQLKRTATAALYRRTVERTGACEGFEVFQIKVRHKGDPLPGGAVEEDDREVYPSANSFGKTAWHCNCLGHAEEVYDDINTQFIKDEEEENKVEEPVQIPLGEFSTTEFAEKTTLSYPQAAVFIRDAIENKTIKFVREERRNTKGKATKIYAKA